MRSAHLAEGVEALLNIVGDTSDNRILEIARACLVALGAQLRALKAQILEFDRLIMAWHRSNEASKRLDEIPGVGPALATALVASVGPCWRRVSATRNPSRLQRERDRAGHPAGCESWEGEQHVMQSRSIRRSGHPTRATAFSNASF